MSGMTGTAQTSAEEFHKVYGLDVVSIPPNKKVVRDDMPDLIYKTKVGKYKAIAKEVKRRNDAGEPVLLGTTSIENNEVLANFLRKEGIPHEILNAKNHEREGEIIAKAGKRGAVTVATNMAGRGVDIVLGGNQSSEENANKVKEAGGLHVLGTERHEARRIDNQLRGRSGRQGDQGSSQFFLSMEDDLLRIFGGERIQGLMELLKLPEDQPIESRMVSKAVNQAQAKVEGANLDMRKHLLEFDDVLNRQRTAIYAKRTKFLELGEKNEILETAKEMAERFVEEVEKRKETAEEGEGEKKRITAESLRKKLETIPKSIEPERSLLIAQSLVRIIDSLWIDHLESLETLRQSVNIRAYGQHEPLVEYRREAHGLYQEMMRGFDSLAFDVVFQLLEANLTRKEEQAPQKLVVPNSEKTGRNDPCPCGSGKKYKRCHGA